MKLTGANSLSKILLLGLMTAATATLTVETQAAQTDPERLIYLFPGVRDDGGGANFGVATAIHCFNFSGVTENVRLVVKNADATVLSSFVANLQDQRTFTAVTHGTVAYSSEFALSTGVVAQGTMGVVATSVNIVCTAHVIDASTTAPNGIALRGVRFNPIPGTQE